MKNLRQVQMIRFKDAHLHEDGDDLDDVSFPNRFLWFSGGCLFDHFDIMDEKPFSRRWASPH